ncbi:Lactoylglutathione lyase, partial [Dysosmobacter welbionis]
GEGLGLAVQILRDAQNLRRLIHPLADLLLGVLLQLQGEGHVLPHSHVGVQSVVLEHHGDIPVLGCHIVHQLAVDIQFAAADLLQAGDHPQGSGLAAAGGAYQHDELLVRNVQAELLHCQHALI